MKYAITLRCPRCRTRKRIIMRSHIQPWEIPADTRCPVCWRNGWHFVSMGIIRVGRGRVRTTHPVPRLLTDVRPCRKGNTGVVSLFPREVAGGE